MKIKVLVGSGDKIGLLAMPFLLVGVVLNILFPAFFIVGGPPQFLKVLSIVMLIPGAIGWLWSVVLILTKVPKGELITTGPFVVVKHPLYTAVSLLVLPWAGFLLNTWLGAVIGIVVYLGNRMYSPGEEKVLSEAFGPAWEAYKHKVLLPWL